ncbi:MAG: hypothetical protein M3Y18_01580 [Candidatus Eremiobacteraeota bacterium]|nr:hypothetical protein [Candidatus Eremiobacteraeota bacterium]
MQRRIFVATQERAIFFKLEHSHGRHFRLQPNARSGDRFDPNSDVIYWDPSSALRTTRGGAQSPALALGHEAAHAVEAPREESLLASRADRQYDNAEERRVIGRSERHAAHALGEAARSDHAGSCYRVKTPVSS